jgi:hypothetical protein
MWGQQLKSCDPKQSTPCLQEERLEGELRAGNTEKLPRRSTNEAPPLLQSLARYLVTLEHIKLEWGEALLQPPIVVKRLDKRNDSLLQH